MRFREAIAQKAACAREASLDGSFGQSEAACRLRYVHVVKIKERENVTILRGKGLYIPVYPPRTLFVGEIFL